MSASVYDKNECIEAVRLAAEEFGESVSIRQYREFCKDTELPSAYTIRKNVGWNEAKRKANLDVYEQNNLIERGPPDILNISETEWKDISSTERNNKRKVAKNAELKLESGCNICGYNEHPAALSWHHTDGSEKIDSVNRMLARGAGDEKLDKEREKCIVICSNCHMSKLNETGYDIN
jgi:hypothetical protein